MKCEWSTYTVQQLIDMGMIKPPMDGNHGAIHPKASDYVSNGIPFIMANDLVNGKVNFRSCAFITETQAATLRKGFAKPGDVLLTHKATIGRTAIVPDDYNTIILTPQVTYYRVIKGLNRRYLKYYFDSNTFQQLFSNWAGAGSTRAYLGITAQRKLPIIVPPIEVQDAIANICGSFDDKIELNNKINENLEQQARALLTQWLIENDGAYKFSLLSQVAIINPDTYSPKDAWEYVNYLDTSSITDGILSEVQYIKPSTEKLPSRARRIIAANDVVFSTVRPNQRHFGIISDPLEHLLASTGFAVIRSNHPSVSNELLYLCLTEDGFIEKMQQLAEQSTSTFPSIKPSDLGTCEIPCPIDQGLGETLKVIFTYISNNQKENRALAQVRDNLLPKLMSGEIDVEDVKI